MINNNINTLKNVHIDDFNYLSDSDLCDVFAGVDVDVCVNFKLLNINGHNSLTTETVNCILKRHPRLKFSCANCLCVDMSKLIKGATDQ